MISVENLWKIARSRWADARALHDAGRHGGAIYLCGYSVELALKARICRTLSWAGWPETASEFGQLKCLKTHDLPTLLRASGVEILIKSEGGLLTRAWVIISEWDPERRYKVPDQDATLPKAAATLVAAGMLMEYLEHDRGPGHSAP